MNNEQQELFDEVYNNYWRQTISNTEDSASLEELDGMCLNTGEIKKVYRQYAPKEFINKCKTDTEFSEKWGLKIEERELSEEERWRIRFDYYPKDKQFPWDRMALPSHRFLDDFNIPRKLITITYKDKTIESHEYKNKI
jgi:hypothetical protein